MKRICLWILSTITVVVLLFGYDGSGSAGTTTASPPAVFSSGSSTSPSSGTSSGTSSTGSSSSTGGTTSRSTTSPSKKSSAATGGTAATRSAKKAPRKKVTKTVTGQTAQTQWGPVQVQLVVSGGTITKVSVVQYPSGNGRDAQINDYALPILVKETTSQQSARIDMVSGATVTSTGYLQSLQSAIDQAGL
jgi:uncharacterized protein with FMN-binding domain